jgi:hypothetical protein
MSIQVQGLAARLKAMAQFMLDGGLTQVATDDYGRLIVQSLSASDHGAADEGSYFVGSAGVAGSTATINTGPASDVPSDTAPFFLIENTATAGPKSPNIWLKRIYVLLSGTQTSETDLSIQGQLDSGLLYSSGGTPLVIANQNPLGPTSVAKAWYGNITKAAKTGAVIYCARSRPRNTIPVTGDEYIWKAGASEGPSSFILSTAGATRQVIEIGPIVIPPQWTFSLHHAFGATSTGAPAIELEEGHIER